MTRLPLASGADVLRALEQGGFRLSHVRGSHHYLRKPGAARLVVVSVHGNRTLPAGTLQSIMRQAALTREELVRLLDA